MRLLAIFCFACAAFAQTVLHYDEVYYPSGNLRIAAYLNRPAGKGPFPVVIYNHGSRAGSEKSSTPFTFAGQLLSDVGYLAPHAPAPGHLLFAAPGARLWREDLLQFLAETLVIGR